MAVRPIKILGKDKVLRQIAQPVKRFDRKLAGLLKDMAETMYAADGVGLAAPQVGVPLRAVVIDVEGQLLELVNPEIVEASDEQVDEEGCLSVPGRRGTVLRPHKVVCIAQTRRGKTIRVEAEGFLAVAICHETDHLDGIIYTDKMIEDTTDKPDEEEAEEEA